MNRPALFLVGLAAAIACEVAPSVIEPTVPGRVIALAETTLPPEFRAAAGWNQLPVDIEAPRATGPCGQSRRKLVSRMDPPTSSSTSSWVVRGCLFSEGNSFRRTFLALTFPDGQVLRAFIAESTPPDREFWYEVAIMRREVTGMTAKLFALSP